MSYAVTVDFEITADDFDRFLERVKIQASDSLQLEQGCLEFKVWTGSAQAGHVYLYEVYESAGAFQEHLQSRHFKQFDAEVAGWILSKKVECWDSPAA